MALCALAWQGSTLIGGPIVGWVGQHVRTRWGLLVGGVPTALIGLIAYPALVRLDRTVAPVSGEADTVAL